MYRHLTLAALAISVLALGALSYAQKVHPGVQVSGTVLDVQGFPVAGATVAMRRDSFSYKGVHWQEPIARASTDQEGHFSFGTVDLRTNVDFSLEHGADYGYSVSEGSGRGFEINEVSFDAPRQDNVVQSIDIRFKVRKRETP